MKNLRTVATIITSSATVAVASVLVSQHMLVAAALTAAIGGAFSAWMHRSPMQASAGLAVLLSIGLAGNGEWAQAVSALGYAAASVVLQSLQRSEDTATAPVPSPVR